MFSIFYNIFPIFLLIVIGYITKIKFLMTDDFWKGCEKITYYLLFPSLLINGLISANFDAHLNKIIAGLIIATLILGLILLFIQRALTLNKSSFTSYFQGAIRYNSYIFIGTASAVYGQQSFSIVAIIIAYMIVITNIFSVVILSIYASQEKPNFIAIIKSIVKNPLVISCLIGIALNKFPTIYPKPIDILFGFLGNASLAISLMCVGAGLKLNHLFDHFKSIFLVTIAKLLILPLISVGIFSLLHIPLGLERNIALLYAAVPCAGNAYILALQMKGDHQAMAAIISMTTLASIITIPVVLFLF